MIFRVKQPAVVCGEHGWSFDNIETSLAGFEYVDIQWYRYYVESILHRQAGRVGDGKTGVYQILRLRAVCTEHIRGRKIC